jgi:hypothetical protein
MTLVNNATYTPIQTYTLNGTTSQVDFTVIDQGYTDLILVSNAKSSAGPCNFWIRVGNSSIDTGSNYSYTTLYGNGSSATSNRNSSTTAITAGDFGSGSEYTTVITQFQNYSNSQTNKTILSRSALASIQTIARVGLWRSTSPITKIQIFPDSGNLTGTFTLYGVGAYNQSTTKATGGQIYSDSTYYYHVFTNSGTFTPTASLTCDYVVIAGGGGGGSGYFAGGGGAGGYRTASSQSLSATAYTVTIGAGGAYNASGSGYDGGTTSFNSLAVTGGGGGSGAYGAGGRSGGSGGGGTAWSGGNSSGGAGNAGSYSPVEGYNGGSGYPQSDGASTGGGGGGGGASAVGGACQAHTGGAGGTGTYSDLTDAVQIGELSGGHYYVAGGGGGGENYPYGGGTNYPGPAGLGGGGIGGYRSVSAPGAGKAATGAGGGGSGGDAYDKGANGGSGLVIVRYAK